MACLDTGLYIVVTILMAVARSPVRLTILGLLASSARCQSTGDLAGSLTYVARRYHIWFALRPLFERWTTRC